MFRRLMRGVYVPLVGVSVALLLLSAGVSRAADVKLQWDANTESTLKGYKVYYKTGTSGPPYDGTGASQGSSPIAVTLSSLADAANPEFTLQGLEDGQTYYICVTAYDDTAESGYSNEVVFDSGATPSEVIIDNLDAGFSMEGSWTASTYYPGYYGSNYHYAAAGDGSRKATWTFNVSSSGQYQLSAQWSVSTRDRSTQAPYTIYNNGSKLETVLANQQINGDRFNALGTYQLSAGTVEVVLSNDISSGYACADAVKLSYLGDGNPAPADTDGDGLTDADETSVYKTDPDKADTDGDGIDDGAEVQYWGAAWNADPDADGLYNLLDADADNDGYNDGTEVDAGYDPGDAASSPGGTPAEVIIDNLDAGFSAEGYWGTSTYYPGYYGSNYRYASAGDGSKKATWTFNVSSSGQYSVSAWWTASTAERPTAVPYTIYNNGVKLETVQVNQQINGGQFNELGTYQLNAGTLEVVLSNDVASEYVSADAVKLAYLADGSAAPADTDGDGLTDADETSVYKTDPDKADTDGDGIDDGAEVQYWGAAWNADPDADGLYNLLDADADNDGYNDGTEVDAGYDPGDAASSPGGTPAEVIIDNLDAGFSAEGYWGTSTYYPGYYGSNYRYASAGDGSKKATWTFNVSSSGQYSVSAWWTASTAERPTAVPYTIYNNGVKLETVQVNQQINGGQFNELGTYQLNAGTLEVVLSNDVASEYVSADAVKLAPLGAGSITIDNQDAAFSTVGTWSVSTKYPGYYGDNYQWAGVGTGSKTATWTFDLPSAGQYRISAWWSAYSNRPPDAPYTIYNNGVKLETVRVDQRVNGGQFNELGTYQLNAGKVEVVLSDDIASGYAIADAVSIEPQ